MINERLFRRRRDEVFEKPGPEEQSLAQTKIKVIRQITERLLSEIDALRWKQDNNTSTARLPLDEQVRNFEEGVIREALIQTGGNQTKAARLLGLKVTTLNSKIKRYQIKISEF